MRFSTDSLGSGGVQVFPAGDGPTKATAEAMLGFATALGARPGREVYLSTPITTGDAYVRWRRATAGTIGRDHPRFGDLHREEVVKHNIAQAAPLVARLRQHFSDRLVIDPTGMADVSGWAQEDYHRFWRAVVKKYAEVVVFANGWQLSNGCVIEFVTALECGARVLDQDLRPLAGAIGGNMVRKAIVSLEDLDEDTAVLRDWLARLSRIAP